MVQARLAVLCVVALLGCTALAESPQTPINPIGIPNTQGSPPLPDMASGPEEEPTQVSTEESSEETSDAGADPSDPPSSPAGPPQKSKLTEAKALSATLAAATKKYEVESKRAIMGPGTRRANARAKCLSTLTRLRLCYESDPGLLSVAAAKQLKKDIAGVHAEVVQLANAREGPAARLVSAVRDKTFQEQFLANEAFEGGKGNVQLNQLLLPLGGTKAGASFAMWFIGLVLGSPAARQAAGPMFDKFASGSEEFPEAAAEFLEGALSGNVNPAKTTKQQVSKVITMVLPTSFPGGSQSVLASLMAMSDVGSKALAIEEEVSKLRLSKAKKPATPRMRNAVGALLGMLANGYGFTDAFSQGDVAKGVFTAVSTATDGAAALEKVVAMNPAHATKHAKLVKFLEGVGHVAKPLAVMDFLMTGYTLVTMDTVYTSDSEKALVATSFVIKYFAAVCLFVPGGQLVAAILAGVALVLDVIASMMPNKCEMQRDLLGYQAGDDDAARAWVDTHQSCMQLSKRSSLTLQSAVKQMIDGYTGMADSARITRIFTCLAKQQQCDKQNDIVDKISLPKLLGDVGAWSGAVKRAVEKCGGVATTSDVVSRTTVGGMSDEEITKMPKRNLRQHLMNAMKGVTGNADEDMVVKIFSVIDRDKKLWLQRQPGTTYDDILSNLHGSQDTEIRKHLIKPIQCLHDKNDRKNYAKAEGSCSRTSTFGTCDKDGECESKGCQGVCKCKTSGMPNTCMCLKELTKAELETHICQTEQLH